MELKVWVEGIQRIVCGVTDKTTCQDVVYALAHATGKTGRFTLIERWRNNERLLAPQEHPLKVLAKWGEYSNDVQFILQRSPLDPATKPPASPSPGKETKAGPGGRRWGGPGSSPGAGAGQTAAIWKSPPGVAASKPLVTSPAPARLPDLSNPRLSPDSGRGSDPTGSDTSNFSDQEKARRGDQPPPHPALRSSQVPGYTVPGWAQGARSRFTSPSPDRAPDTLYGFSARPPAYRPPPQPLSGGFRPHSPASDPPPYRDPPPPPGSQGRGGPTSPVLGRHVSGLPHVSAPAPVVRAPHYSPPPHHRELRGHKGPSPGRSGQQPPSHRTSASPSRGQASPSRVTSWGLNRSAEGQQWPPAARYQPQGPGKSDYTDLMSLVQAQQSRLQSQQAEIKHCENELKYWDGVGPGRPAPEPAPAQLEAVLTEVRRLEEAAARNEEELSTAGGSIDTEAGAGPGIRGELDQLKHRLEMTDIELQKTNTTLRRLSDEMRSYSIERGKEREEELRGEVDRIHQEIKLLQRNNEDSATISDKLSREVAEVEHAILTRKGEVEKLIADMKSANLESLTISPPEETKAFLDDISGPAKPGTTRKMLGSPRQLENAVPTSKNPHGVWV